MDLEYSPNILETPSLVTPNISSNQLVYRPTHTISSDDATNVNNNNTSTSNSSSTTTTNDESLTVSTAEIKLSQIEHELMQSFSQRRLPTESPFQRIVGGSSLTTEKNIVVLPTTDDGIPVDVPSTAEVMNDIESFSKYSNKDNSERETTTTTALNSDNNRFDTSPTHNMGVIVSPKKKLLIRSQSHTEPTSPPNNVSQSQRNNFEDDTSSTDDDHTSSINNHFQRVHDLPILPHPIDSNTQLNNHLEPSYTIQLRADQNGVLPTVIKQQPMTFSNKRTLQQTMIGAPIPKANSIIISQQPFINEVTSSDPLIGVKRQKMTPMPTNTITLRPTSSSSTTNTNNNNNNNNMNNGGSDDQRKKQIRDSNREAARRCRERRRNYIEQLEGNLEQCKTQLNKLSEKVSRAERDNTQLRAIITEAKLFPSSTRLSLPSDFANAIITSNGIDLNSESTDGNIIPRIYSTRNTN